MLGFLHCNSAADYEGISSCYGASVSVSGGRLEKTQCALQWKEVGCLQYSGHGEEGVCSAIFSRSCLFVAYVLQPEWVLNKQTSVACFSWEHSLGGEERGLMF